MDRSDPDDSSAGSAVEPTHTALLTLHELAGTYDGVGEIPSLGRPGVAEALSTLAVAPVHEASVGLKLDTLVALARAGFPDYERTEQAYLQLGEAIGVAHGVDADQVLSDAKAVALGDAAIAETATGTALPHHATAFVGQDVCDIREVTVDGIPAVWIFSEFETDAPFVGVADWVRPESWPKRGPAMFKGMHVVGDQPTEIAGHGYTDHWHGVYLEDVQLVERLKTLLHCDYYENAAEAAGVTYRLDFSVGHKLTVDRGFLLVEDLGPVRRVKALKIVAFTDTKWNEVAKLVCPFWTDFVRQAAEGGTSSSPRGPGAEPAPTGEGEGGGGGSRIDDRGLTDLWAAWIDFVGEAAKAYAALAGDATGKMLAGSYGRQDLVDDGTAYWRQLAKDWAQAWGYGAEMMTAMAKEGLVTPRPPGAEDETGSRFPPFVPPAGAGPSAAVSPAGAPTAAAVGAPSVGPRAVGGTVESVTVPIPGLAPGSSVSCTDLTGIEAGAPVIPSAAITVSVVEIAPPQRAARLSVDVSGAAPGLYTGEILVDAGGRIPVAFYVSRARMAP